MVSDTREQCALMFVTATCCTPSHVSAAADGQLLPANSRNAKVVLPDVSLIVHNHTATKAGTCD